MLLFFALDTRWSNESAKNQSDKLRDFFFAFSLRLKPKKTRHKQTLMIPDKLRHVLIYLKQQFCSVKVHGWRFSTACFSCGNYAFKPKIEKWEKIREEEIDKTS